MDFEFATAARIVFAPGAVLRLPALVAEFGSRVLVVTGRSPVRAEPLIAALQAPQFMVSLFACPGEPSVEDIRAAAALARAGCDVVVGFGGGSAIDAAKAIAAVAANSGDPLDYLEVVGRGRGFENPPLPFIAVPTTAGTGAEVTRNAVLFSPEHGMKASVRSPHMLAKLAVIDPDLTLSLPPEVTAYTGLDAFTQLLEPFVSLRANPMTNLFCAEGLHRVRTSLLRAFRNPGDHDARASMSYASLLGGLSLSNSGLGVVHGLAAPLGGMLQAPHGSLVAAVLHHGVEMNIHALRRRAPHSEALGNYRRAAQILTAVPTAEAEDLLPWIAGLCGELHVSGLAALGFKPNQIPELVEKAARASSMRANPIQLTREELAAIAEHAL
jgi:alcohol dehydrogenase class IV